MNQGFEHFYVRPRQAYFVDVEHLQSLRHAVRVDSGVVDLAVVAAAFQKIVRGSRSLPAALCDLGAGFFCCFNI